MGKAVSISTNPARIFVMVALMVGAAACVDPSSKIETALTGYGLDQGQARCVGEDLEEALSVDQLRQLGRAARAFKEGDTDPDRLTVGDLMRVSAEIDDAKVPLEVARATAACGLIGAPAGS